MDPGHEGDVHEAPAAAEGVCFKHPFFFGLPRPKPAMVTIPCEQRSPRRHWCWLGPRVVKDSHHALKRPRVGWEARPGKPSSCGWQLQPRPGSNPKARRPECLRGANPGAPPTPMCLPLYGSRCLWPNRVEWVVSRARRLQHSVPFDPHSNPEAIPPAGPHGAVPLIRPGCHCSRLLVRFGRLLLPWVPPRRGSRTSLHGRAV